MDVSYVGFRGFKALKQSTKLLFLQLRRSQDALETYTELLTYTKSAVTRNYSEKSINNILDYVGGGKSGPVDVEILEKFYQATKKALVEAKNEVGTTPLAAHVSISPTYRQRNSGSIAKSISDWQRCALISVRCSFLSYPAVDP